MLLLIPVRHSALTPLAVFSHQSDKRHSESGAPTLSIPPGTKHAVRPFLGLYSCVHACVHTPTLRLVSMFSVLALLSVIGSNMSTFKEHDTMLQDEHIFDWYFQSAGLATL